MDAEQVILKTEAFVRHALADAEGGHDWWHIQRVWNTARTIHAQESGEANALIVHLGALLHDIADSKFHDGNEDIGPQRAAEWLQELGVDAEVVNHVRNIIANISFKGGNHEQQFHSLELDIVQDADRLDAMGAIGIARTFNYGGHKGRALYDPEIAPQLNMTKEEYKASTAPTINHFYEKLLLLKDRMNTATGKAMAEQRHQFMEQYLEQFYAEWKGDL